jgi:hypothetical protein
MKIVGDCVPGSASDNKKYIELLEELNAEWEGVESLPLYWPQKHLNHHLFINLELGGMVTILLLS